MEFPLYLHLKLWRNTIIFWSYKSIQSFYIDSSIGIQKLQLSFGAPIFGSIVNFSRKLHRHRTAWGGSTSCSSISSSSDSSYSRDFPNRLPQSSVDLELGVIGERLVDQPTGDDEADSNKLLRQARLWRQRSQLNRDSAQEY
jgi:hypothetical protein